MTESDSPPKLVPSPPSSQTCESLIAVGLREAQTLGVQNKLMLASLDEQQALIAELVESRNQLAGGYESLQTAFGEEEDRRLAAEQKLVLLEISSGSLADVMKEADAAREALEIQLEASQAKVQQLQEEAQRNACLADLMKEADAVREALETQLEASQAKVQQLQEEAQRNKLQATDRDKKLSDARLRVGVLQSELETAQQQLQSATEEAAQLTTVNDALKDQLKSTGETLKNSEAKASLLKDVWTAREALDKHNTELQDQLVEAHREVQQLGQRVHGLTDENEQLKGALAESQAAAGREDQDANDLQWRCEAAEQANANLQMQVKEQLGRAEGRMRKADARIAELEAQCNVQLREMKHAQGFKAEMRDSNDGLQLRIEKAEARMNEEALARKKEAKRAKEAEARCGRLQGEITALKENLQSAQDGMGMMRTIAKIRNLDDGELPVGFDAVGERTIKDNKGKKTGRRRRGSKP